MQHGWRVAAAGASMLAVTVSAGCTSSSDSDPAASASSSASAAAAAASTSPGVYGAPIDPTTPDPTDVAVDPPVTVTPNADGGLPVALTFADWNATTAAVEVDGYLAGLVEDGGTCTLTLTQGGTTVTAEVPGTADAATTSCGGATVPGTDLAPGTWTAVLSYRSDTTTGSSAPAEVTVP
jgi:hypothetical protein